MSGPLSAGERRTLAEMEQGLTVRPRNRDAGPCRAVSAAHGLGCDLVLAEHLVHHDPDGLWWAGAPLSSTSTERRPAMAKAPKPSRADKQKAKFQAAKTRTAKAAAKDAASKEELRKKMESGQVKPPARLSRKELRLAARMDDGSGGPVRTGPVWRRKSSDE